MTGRRNPTPLPILTALAAVIVALLAASSAGARSASKASSLPPDPAKNIPVDWGTMPPECRSAPTGQVCEASALRQLNASRAVMGLPAYTAPAGFLALSPASQVLILTNLDRKAYGMEPVGGLNHRLDRAAMAAAAAGEDPSPPDGFFTTLAEAGYSGNWAGGGIPNILLAYDLWMYDDGYGAGNLACPSPSSDGCWGHRHDVFAFPTGVTTAMGVAVARFEGQSSFTQLIVGAWPKPGETAAKIRYSVDWRTLAQAG